MSVLRLPVGPYLVPRYTCKTGGVDFLGLRQANLELMQECLPGINNVTGHVRCYSLVCWIHWKFYQLATAGGLEEIDSDALREFREKVETLFTWGHKLKEVRGVPGRLSNPPKTRSAQVPLDFEAWGREASNTSLMAAVQYGPSSKTTEGLGFLEAIATGMFRVRGAGVELAESLETRLQGASLKANLNSLGTGWAGEEEALHLFQYWDIRQLDQGEQRAFRRALFDGSAIGRDTRMGRRSSTIALIREVLDQATDSLEVAEVRERMAFLVGASGLHNDPLLKPAWIRWLVLQIRQVQRLGLEGLLRWIQHRILEHDEHSTPVMVAVAKRLFKESEQGLSADSSVGHSIRTLLGDGTDLGAWLSSARQKADLSPFRLTERFDAAASEDPDRLLGISMSMLLLVAHMAHLIDAIPEARPLLSVGGEVRISLARWCGIVRDHENDTLTEFLQRVLEHEVLSQHFAVAAGRFDGGVQRLQLSVEEEGLVTLAPKPFAPFVTADRLQSVLSLMGECGLARETGEGRFSIGGN